MKKVLIVSASYYVDINKSLLIEAKIALDKGCGRFEWSCLDWNKPSRDFYESIGAVSQDEWVGYRMSGETLVNFAAGK